MKKLVLGVAGIVVIVGLVFWLRQMGAQSIQQGDSKEYLHKDTNSENQESLEQKKSGSRNPIGVAEENVESEDPIDSEQLSAAVKSLLLLDGKEHNYPSLLAEINKLDYKLSSEDVTALVAFLSWPNEQFPEDMRNIEINAVKNDVLDKLLRQEILPEGVGIAMADMAADPSQDVVWRDYCVQFMAPFYERAYGDQLASKVSASTEDHVSHQSDSSVDELKVITEAMFLALNQRASTIAGTALIGLENLSRSYDEFDREEITLKAVEIASDEIASTESRITALRLAGGLVEKKSHAEGGAASANVADGCPHDEVVAAARSLAQTGDTVLMRSAALVTLGELGSQSDRELLESYLHDDNRQIASAAMMALDKLD